MATKFNEKLIKNAIEDKFTEICAKILPVEGYGVYDLRYLSGSSTLRVFITKGDFVKGIDINDCVKVDKLLSPIIDEESWVPDNFVLEVSSPGLYRDIRFSEQLKYSVGELIKIKFNSLIDDNKLKNKNYVGILVNFDESELTVKSDENGEQFNIKYEMVKSVNAELKI
jgi:ribosome maturation factor RimP